MLTYLETKKNKQTNPNSSHRVLLKSSAKIKKQVMIMMMLTMRRSKRANVTKC